VVSRGAFILANISAGYGFTKSEKPTKYGDTIYNQFCIK
jgi:hypothetical protein